MKIHKLLQKGDTIVEVLISTAVVSIVLLSAITISNKSLQQIRTAQERTEAQKIAQSSVERLETAVATIPALSATGIISSFCIDTSGTYRLSSLPECTSFDLYETVITRTSTSPYTFSINVSWAGLNGTTEQVTINYRVRRAI